MAGKLVFDQPKEFGRIQVGEDTGRLTISTTEEQAIPKWQMVMMQMRRSESGDAEFSDKRLPAAMTTMQRRMFEEELDKELPRLARGGKGSSRNMKPIALARSAAAGAAAHRRPNELSELSDFNFDAGDASFHAAILLAGLLAGFSVIYLLLSLITAGPAY